MKLEYSDKYTCCVTHHLVDEVSLENPELLRNRSGTIRLYETLYYLGFKVNFGMLNKNISIHPDCLIRSSEDYTKCYRTKVYKGIVRKAVLNVKDGNIIYDKYNHHHLLDDYLAHEVLQASNLSKYIEKDELLNVEDFGGKSKLSDCIISEEEL